MMTRERVMWSLVAVLMGACSATNEGPDAGRDSGVDDSGVEDSGVRDAGQPVCLRDPVAPDSDGGACNCALDDAGVLTMSWECFCNNFDCGGAPTCTGDKYIDGYSACGLRISRRYQPVADDEAVFQDGVLTGKTLFWRGSAFICPDDSSLKGTTVTAGRFPCASCTYRMCHCSDLPSCE